VFLDVGQLFDIVTQRIDDRSRLSIAASHFHLSVLEPEMEHRPQGPGERKAAKNDADYLYFDRHDISSSNSRR
jgi:hypothetical protein